MEDVGKFPCNQCDYISTTNGNLTKHRKALHDRVKYPCDKCDKQYQTISDVNRHKKAIHEGIKYTCPECDHQFGQRSHLKEHRMVHSSTYIFFVLIVTLKQKEKVVLISIKEQSTKE